MHDISTLFKSLSPDGLTGPALSNSREKEAELPLGYRLPAAYLRVLATKNGGYLRRRRMEIPFETSSGENFIEIDGLLGIGGPAGIIADNGLGSPHLVAEWGYPNIGIVVCDMPSGGHDAVMLDYSACGSNGEPSVAFIDEDRVPRTIADSFASFIDSLT